MIIQHLIVEEYGSFIGKHSERLIVTDKDGNKKVQAPLMHLEAVLISNNGISLSADVVRECAERGIPIHFVSKSGTPYASMYSAGLGATVLTRRAQMEAFKDHRGLLLAITFVRGKIHNQVNLLKYVAKYRKEAAPQIYEQVQVLLHEVQDGDLELEDFQRQTASVLETAAVLLTDAVLLTVDAYRGQILSSEGRAAHKYWEAIRLLLPDAIAQTWPGREHQGARDVFNSALNYGYGVLYKQIERSLVLAGLDPYAGFIHVDRPGKPSLVLDAIEEFRQPIVDRTVLGLLNKGVTLGQDERGRLDDAARRLLAEKVLARLEVSESYEGKRLPLRAIMQSQARHMAQYFRGERESYEAFAASW